MFRDISPASAGSATATTSPTTLRRRWLRFTGHFLLMLAAMYLGMLTLYPAYDFLADRAGYADPTTELPILSALMMAFTMTAPMAALMLHHRHGWRPITEMAAAMVVPTFAATLLHLTGTNLRALRHVRRTSHDDPGHARRHAPSLRALRRT